MSARLVESPVFILSAVRSGSTLLRCVLDSHSRVHAPHELHLTHLGVRARPPFADAVLDALGLSEHEVEHLLWDRILHEQLRRSGKEVIVEKSPTNILDWRRIAACWPRARYIFLLRRPEHILGSMLDAAKGPSGRELRRTGRTEHEHWGSLASAVADLRPALRGLVEARAALPGLTVRYEDLVADPASVTRGICGHLDLPWEPDMLHYGRHDHGPFKVFLGDMGERIGSGEILTPREHHLPADAAAATELQEFHLPLGYQPAPDHTW
ncbi:sulfotransferase [Streptomyces sp. NPDC048659]|uniref:sulfotransferase family protein n=1 Tax=Streptomyces sp. NPDC048659 TaxID=3155489 RepID=UPI00344A5E68